MKACMTLKVPQGANELKAVIDGANKANPTKEARTALAAAFDKYPQLAQDAGNLARSIRASKIESLGSSYLLQEAVNRTIEDIERELGYEQAPMASKLLIEAVLLSWVDLAQVENRHSASLSGSHTLSLGRYWDERLTRAQARYLRALETLARVNRLYRIVPVQVNIAQQQVNVANLPPR